MAALDDQIKTATNFLRDLYGGDDDGNVEVRVVLNHGGSEKQMFLPSDRQLKNLFKHYADKRKPYALYYGVGRRRDGATRGNKPAVASVPGLWADIDVNKRGWCMEDVIGYFWSLPGAMQPTALVESGGGLHAYWLFHEPFRFLDPEQYPDEWHTQVSAFEQVNKTFQLIMGSDMVFDITRCMRLPGSFNTKAGTVSGAKGVGVPWFHWWHRHTLKELSEAISEFAGIDEDGRPERVLDRTGFVAPEDVEDIPDYDQVFKRHHRRGDRTDEKTSPFAVALEHALNINARSYQQKAAEIWDRCRYGSDRYPYIGVDEAIMRATAFRWCMATREKASEQGTDDIRQTIIDWTLEHVRRVQERDAPEESWDWIKEEQKIAKQLDRWTEKWARLKPLFKKEAAAKRKAEREQQKAEKD